MQVFIIGSPLETAKALDKRRLNKQIIECEQILKAINGETDAYKNHPCTIQYREHVMWLKWYQRCLDLFKRGDLIGAEGCNNSANMIKPKWHTETYFNQMKRRLYTKDKEYYKQWASLGESNCNWYWSQKENRFIKYINGKKLNDY